MKTTIFFTTATSATDSILRILCTMTGMDFVGSKYVDPFARDRRIAELRSSTIPLDGGLHRFNRPTDFNKSMDLGQYRTLVNFRDPRDRLCNMYHWAMVHMVPGLSDAEVAQRAHSIREEGIDAWVLRKADVAYYDNVLWLLERLRQHDHAILTYARLCLDFDSFLAGCARFLDITLTDQLLTSLEIERVENLEKNPKWIGNRWNGSDVLPGRYKRELAGATVALLNDRFGTILEQMATYDADFADTYSCSL